MTLEEFSNEFDILAASYRRFKDFDDKENLDSIEFDEYEKSLYLTRSQEDLVLSLYSGRNITANSFEETEELRRYLANLVCTDKLEPITTTSGHPLGIESNSKFFTLPNDLWFITYESAVASDGQCGEGSFLEVVPTIQDEYNKLKNNPFRGPNNRRALRLDLADGVVELVSKYTITEYCIRYIKKLSPIVLVALPDGISIEGVMVESPCKLHEALHKRILDRAVRMALQSKGYTFKENN